MEKNFLRKKTITLFEKTSELINVQTGEIVSLAKQTVKKTSQEPEYIKLYYQAMMGVTNISEIPLDFLLALSSQISFTNNKKPMYFYSNRVSQQEISQYCNIKNDMTKRYLKRCVEKGVLFKTGTKGIYEVNPWLIAKGKWENIKELQANFCFVEGKWERIIRLKQPNN